MWGQSLYARVKNPDPLDKYSLAMVGDCGYKLLSLCLFVSAEKVNFIDFDFSAFNYQAYDIARHFCDYTGSDNYAIIFCIY